MKKNFTKGEWKVGRQGTVVSDTIPENCLSNTGHTDIKYYGGYLIAESIANKADAKLIAAAPDLLEALSKLFDKTQTLIEYTADQGFIDWEDETIEGVINMENAKKMAIEALKKATE